MKGKNRISMEKAWEKILSYIKEKEEIINEQMVNAQKKYPELIFSQEFLMGYLSYNLDKVIKRGQAGIDLGVGREVIKRGQAGIDLGVGREVIKRGQAGIDLGVGRDVIDIEEFMDRYLCKRHRCACWWRDDQTLKDCIGEARAGIPDFVFDGFEIPTCPTAITEYDDALACYSTIPSDLTYAEQLAAEQECNQKINDAWLILMDFGCVCDWIVKEKYLAYVLPEPQRTQRLAYLNGLAETHKCS